MARTIARLFPVLIPALLLSAWTTPGVADGAPVPAMPSHSLATPEPMPAATLVADPGRVEMFVQCGRPHPLPLRSGAQVQIRMPPDDRRFDAVHARVRGLCIARLDFVRAISEASSRPASVRSTAPPPASD